MQKRLPAKDPRTVARDIPGVFDALFPQLVSGVVAYFNRKARPFADVQPLPEELVKVSKLSHSMLFEIAYVRAEQLLAGVALADWESCISQAVERQKRHFDALIPDAVSHSDQVVAEWVASNLANCLRTLSQNAPLSLRLSPVIPGFQWIASGAGDFAIGRRLVEVKCTAKRFSASDYRQIIMYWLLSYAASIEGKSVEWESGILLNPRLNLMVEFSFGEILSIVAAGRSKVDILELFSAAVGEYTLRMLADER
jgi:hypothetical protein